MLVTLPKFLMFLKAINAIIAEKQNYTLYTIMEKEVNEKKWRIFKKLLCILICYKLYLRKTYE